MCGFPQFSFWVSIVLAIVKLKRSSFLASSNIFDPLMSRNGPNPEFGYFI